MFKRANLVSFVLAGSLFAGCKSPPTVRQNSPFSHFVGITDFSGFDTSTNRAGEIVLSSQPITVPFVWNQLIVSWNADAPAETFVKIEARALSGGNPTQYYTMGLWSPDNKTVARTSLSGQADADGTVNEDTLVLNRPARATQIRVTLGGTNGILPKLRFLGICFSDTKVAPPTHPPNRSAWGKIIPTPERSQHGYPNASGWCSPTSVSMVLARWAEVLQRPELNLTVPQVASAVYDRAFDATGNWPFNTAFAGSFPGMRAYVTRFDDLSEVEDWIAAGIPVILSARWDWLKPGRPHDAAGHLIVCIGFTKKGDVVVNDPATRLEKGEFVRRIYKRADVLHAWGKSHHAVYLIYPIAMPVPPNRLGQWADESVATFGAKWSRATQ